MVVTKASKRMHVVMELLHTETNYTAILHTLIHVSISHLGGGAGGCGGGVKLVWRSSHTWKSNSFEGAKTCRPCLCCWVHYYFRQEARQCLVLCFQMFKEQERKKGL